MLCLGRKKGEWIVITLPDDRPVRIQISDVRKSGTDRAQVRLAIDAPADVRIMRGEVVLRVEEVADVASEG